MVPLNSSVLRTLTDVYIYCDARCESISLQARATDLDLQMHETYLLTADGSLDHILAYQVTAPADALAIADLIAHIYRTSAKIGAFPAYDVASALLGKLIASTPNAEAPEHLR